MHAEMHYSSASYAYAHSSAQIWADILSALQLAWPVDVVNNQAGDRAGETPSTHSAVQRGSGKHLVVLGI